MDGACQIGCWVTQCWQVKGPYCDAGKRQGRRVQQGSLLMLLLNLVAVKMAFAMPLVSTMLQELRARQGGFAGQADDSFWPSPKTVSTPMLMPQILCLWSACKAT